MKKELYNFIWIHSLITWMFTFFLPVLLYKTGFSLAEISLFISITWWSFVIFLYIWDVIRYNKWLKTVIYLSFLLEILLIIIALFINDSLLFLVISAVLYWGFNCFSWVTQRVLFIANSKKDNVWNNFWNIQIITFILLKIWIFIWAFLLENNYLYVLLFITAILNIYGMYYFSRKNFEEEALKQFIEAPILPIKKIVKFKDNLNSKIIFLLDGPFLFFESFFWLITLFFISNQNYTELWLLVILLVLSFSGIFILIKNKVDIISSRNILYFWVLVYFLSWIWRWFLWNIDDKNLLYALVLFIAFATSFFRLIFNKQFYHTAKNVDTHNYLLIKSYYSQLSICIVFGVISYILYISKLDINLGLSITYIIASFFSLFFVLYKPIQD